MNEKQYVDAIARKIKCTGKRKKEIKKQLLMDIQMRVKQGEELKEIISQMGTAAEIADGFNENISLEEQKRYSRNKVLKIVIPIVAILILLGSLVYWIFPKTADIGQSRYFNKEQVEAAMKETVELLDAGDYTALQESAVSKMKPYLTEKTVDEIRRTLSDDWGERKQFGAVYMVELIQANKHFAVGEMTVTYENISVTYRLTYDEDMRFAGVYVR
ncbi:MAG: DUF3887 domain-containing protein [Lachnospiraceae bacterium]|nr:DUF3887 domain-containing protein [Lachnospiraceae bacterium]